MVCTANDLSEWKDFPKGLRILLLDENNNSAAEIRSKLEALDYVVSTFCNESDALSAISSGPENFHAAIVEISNSNNSGGLKFLETAKDLPTIMTSEVQCLNTMMKCIALGAVEFLKKPLSEDKLRNIWQHVVHKAFNAGGIAPSKSLKPIKESVISMLHLPLENETLDVEKPEEVSSPGQECYSELSPGKDRYPAPSTPQLKLCERLPDDGDCQDHTNCSTGKENSEQCGESKSVETTCDNSMVEVNVPVGHLHTPISTVIKDEDDSAEGSKSENSTYLELQNEEIQRDPCSGAEKSKLNSGGTNKTNRKKLKVDWTPELHKKFVKAVEQLGIDRAIPSKILELMKADGLTRHNVASHLQKYRMQKRHILPKEDDRKWAQRDHIQRNHYMHKPIMAFPAYYPHPGIPAAPNYPMWGAPHPGSMHMWDSPYYHSWQQTDNCNWKQYPGLQADAWGCPVMQSPHGFCSPTPQSTPVPQCNNFTDKNYPMPRSGVEPEEDIIDKVVKEAICKPWLPLPLGLKPPSAESVLAELSRQGISNILPH